MSKEKRRKQVHSYLKYSGIAFQLGATILLGALAGRWLDQHFETPQPYFTIACSLLAIFAGLYLSLKDFFQKPKV